MKVAVVLFALGWLAWGIGLFLALYLDLRIHALRQSGDLPRKTDQLLGWNVGVDVGYLYSSRLRLLDGHTRALVPIIRAAFPTGAFLAILALVLD